MRVTVKGLVLGLLVMGANCFSQITAETVWKGRAVQARERLDSLVKADTTQPKVKAEILLEKGFEQISSMRRKTVVQTPEATTYWLVYLVDEDLLQVGYWYKKGASAPATLKIAQMPKTFQVMLHNEKDMEDAVSIGNGKATFVFFRKNPFMSYVDTY